MGSVWPHPIPVTAPHRILHSPPRPKTPRNFRQTEPPRPWLPRLQLTERKNVQPPPVTQHRLQSPNIFSSLLIRKSVKQSAVEHRPPLQPALRQTQGIAQNKLRRLLQPHLLHFFAGSLQRLRHRIQSLYHQPVSSQLDRIVSRTATQIEDRRFEFPLLNQPDHLRLRPVDLPRRNSLRIHFRKFMPSLAHRSNLNRILPLST